MYYIIHNMYSNYAAAKFTKKWPKICFILWLKRDCIHQICMKMIWFLWMICIDIILSFYFFFRLIFCQKWSVCQSKLIKHWMSDKLKDHEVSQAETRFRHAPMRLSFFVASSSPLFCDAPEKSYTFFKDRVYRNEIYIHY